MRYPVILLAALLVVVAACGDTTDTVDTPETSTTVLGEGKADEHGEARVRAAGMTIWADMIIRTAHDGWVLSARSSFNLAHASASIAGTEVDVELVSARKFEVTLDAGQLVATLEETPLLVELETTSGLTRTVMFASRARVGDSSGSSKIYPWRNFSPVMVDEQSVFRGRLTTDGEFVSADGRNDDDSEPQMHREDATHWIVDFPAYALPWAAHPTEDPVVYVVEDEAGNRYSRDVHIIAQLSQIGVTSDAPSAAWPAPTCTETVRTCVHDLGRAADLEACGSTAEVRPCLDELPEDNTDELKEAFADGLRSAIIDYYAVREQDIVASGGNSRTQALRSVDTRDIDEVTDPQDVPSGHDLADYRVFSHPDVAFPGSDIRWYGIFDRSDDSLVEVSNFN